MLTLDTPAGAFRALALGDGPTLVWLHGFPDHPPTARPFLDELARHRRVIAPWLRGYAPSPLAGPYDLETLARDVIAMIDTLGGPVELVGHDWGAAITYAVCARAPERIRAATTLALPHPLTFLRALRSPRQLRRSWYMALFQLPFAERLVRAHHLALIDRLWRAWSPDFTLDDDRRRALHACLADSLPAPLGYYRAMLRSLPRTRPPRLEPRLLQLHGADDGCVLPPTTADDAWRFRERTLGVIPNAGHFLHLEHPAAIAARIVAWSRG